MRGLKWMIAALVVIGVALCGPPTGLAGQEIYQDNSTSVQVGAVTGVEGIANDGGYTDVQAQGVLSPGLDVDLVAIVAYQMKAHRYRKHAIPAIGQVPEVLDPGSTGDNKSLTACNLGKRVRAGIRRLLCCG